MKPRHHSENLISVIAAVLLAIFVYTALNKLIQSQHFYIVLRSSPWLASFAGQLAWIIPVTELLLAAGLFIRPLRAAALLLSALVLLFFTLYVAAMLLLSPQLPCGCGGIFETLSWPQHLLVNLLLTGLAFIAWHLERKNKTAVAIAPGYASADIAGRSSRTPV